MPTDNDNICYTCENMVDTDQSFHFNVCKTHHICVDCESNYCEGKDYIEKVKE